METAKNQVDQQRTGADWLKESPMLKFQLEKMGEENLWLIFLNFSQSFVTTGLSDSSLSQSSSRISLLFFFAALLSSRCCTIPISIISLISDLTWSTLLFCAAVSYCSAWVSASCLENSSLICLSNSASASFVCNTILFLTFLELSSCELF